MGTLNIVPYNFKTSDGIVSRYGIDINDISSYFSFSPNNSSIKLSENYTISFWNRRIKQPTSYWEVIIGANNYAIQTGDYSTRDIDGVRINNNRYELTGTLNTTRMVGVNNYITLIGNKDKNYMSLYENGKLASKTSWHEFYIQYIHMWDEPNSPGSPGIIDDLIITKQILWEDEFTPPSTRLLDNCYSLYQNENNIYSNTES